MGGDPILADGMTMDDNLALLYPSEINEMIDTFTSLCDGSVKKVDKIFRYKNSSGGYFHYECKIISKVVNGSVKIGRAHV